MDQLAKEFNALGERIKRRVPMDELDQAFDRAGRVHTFEGEVVWLLKRKKGLSSRLRRADLSILPDELYLRENLLAPVPDESPQNERPADPAGSPDPSAPQLNPPSGPRAH